MGNTEPVPGIPTTQGGGAAPPRAGLNLITGNPIPKVTDHSSKGWEWIDPETPTTQGGGAAPPRAGLNLTLG